MVEPLDTQRTAPHDDLHGPARPRRAAQAREPRVHAARDHRARAVRAQDRDRLPRAARASKGGGDFVEEFSAMLPMNVIMELLGVPAADRNTLRHWMDATLDRLEEPPYIPDHAIEAMGKTGEYWASLLADKRAHPDDGFISKLCEAEIVDDDGTDRATHRSRGDRLRVAHRVGRHRDAHEAARERGRAVPPQSRSSGRRCSTIPAKIPGRGRGDAALLAAVAVPGPRAHRRRDRARRRRCRRAHACCCSPRAGEPRRARVRRRRPLRHRTHRRTSRSASGTACTSASAPRWPGSKAGSGSRSSRRRFPQLRDRRGARPAACT